MLDNLQKLTSSSLKPLHVTRKVTTHPASNMLDSYAQATGDTTEVDLGWGLVLTFSGGKKSTQEVFLLVKQIGYLFWVFFLQLVLIFDDFQWILDVFFHLYDLHGRERCGAISRLRWAHPPVTTSSSLTWLAGKQPLISFESMYRPYWKMDHFPGNHLSFSGGL